jgi:4,5-DOPA dioxygenase extradiol
MAVPSDEHYLPLLYFAGVRHQQDALHTSVRGFDLGSLSMRSSLFSG